MSFLVWYWQETVRITVGTFQYTAPYGAPALLGALLFASLHYYDKRRRAGRKADVQDFVKSVFSERILWHPSSRIDMRLWALNTLVFAAGYGLLAAGGILWRDATISGLTQLFGAHTPTSWPIWTILALATVLELLAYEFGYWSSHYIFHLVPALWEFHKVHHSAEVLTTFTEMRTHPVEIISFMNVIALFTGIVFGVMTYAFGPGVHPFTLLHGNIVLMGFLVTIGHLRHSHMWIPFKGWAGKLFQSPAHHQIHHSINPKHFNRNLGFALAVFDWAFGTLYLPQKRERIVFGVGAQHADFAGVARNYVMPFVKAWAALKKPA